MPQKDPFVHKLLKRFEKIDTASLKQCLLDLSEETALYSEVLNHLQEGVILAEEDGNILFLNPEAERWLGLQKDTDRPLHLVKDLGDSELAKFIREHWQRADRVVGDFQVLTPREARLRAFVIPLQNSESRSLILLLNISDPSHDRPTPSGVPAEALLSLAAGVAHEIGNPLNSISIHLQLLKKQLAVPRTPSPSQLVKSIQVLESETQRLDKIVRNFLKATRKPPLRFRPEDLHKMIEEAIDVLTPELAQQKIRLEYRKDAELPLFLMDRLRLYQAFMNLMKNAMESMPKGGALKISVSHKEKVAMIRFQDEGEGILEKDLPHIFEAYYTTKEEGSGLGLVFVLNAIREHGGRIEVASKVGKGTTFIVLLPIRQPRLQLSQDKPGKDVKS